jgi:hypothetical protein
MDETDEKKCPNCDSDKVEIAAVARDAIEYKCESCGHTWKNYKKKKTKKDTPEVPPEEEKEKQSKFSKYSKLRVVKFLFYFVVMVVLPMIILSSYITMWGELIYPTVIKLMPNYAMAAVLAPYLIIGAVGLLLSIVLSKQGYFTGGFVLVIYFVGLVLIPAIIPIIQGPGGELGKYLDSFGCSITHISDPLVCQSLITQTPEGKKADEGYDVIDVKLGNPNRNYELSTMYKGQYYSLSVNIENKIPKKAVSLYVEGYLEDENCNDKLYCKDANYIKFVPDECSKDNPCDISKKKTITLTTDREVSGINITDTDAEGKEKIYKISYSSYAKIKIMVTYSFSTDGKADFVIFKSENDVTDVPVPEKGPGPLDVVVFFSPDYYVAGKPLGKENKMRTFISVKNMREGSAVLKQIQLNRLPEFSDISSGVCKTNFDKNTFNEGENYDLGANQLPRDEEYVFTCDHTLSVSSLSIPSKTIKFITNLDYDYRLTYTKSMRVTPV